MKFMHFSIKYRYSDILLENKNFIYNCLFFCNPTCYCVDMVSVTSALRFISQGCREIQNAVSKLSLVNLISKDASLVILFISL